MATVTLNRSVLKARPVESLPAYWSSLWKPASTEPSRSTPAAAPPAEKSSALVGDLWIQIR